MAIADWRSRLANGDPHHVDIANPSEDQDSDEEDDVYEGFPGLNPVRW